MERVETLAVKLQEQIAQKVPIDQLLMTVQMIQSELQHLRKSDPPSIGQDTAAVNLPFQLPVMHEEPPVPEEKTVEVLQVDEAEVEAELEEMKKTLESRDKIHAQAKPPIVFDPVEDTPTLTHQKTNVTPVKELHEVLPVENTASLNERLNQQQAEVSHVLQEVAIKDLRKGIGVNDRFLFINELFRGDEVMYERSIKTINGFTIFPEAEYWIKRELKLKLAWNEGNPVVKQFDQLVRRRFSAM
jgi:hypothetical protein